VTDWLSDNRRFLLRFIGTLLAIGLIVLLVRGQGWDGDVQVIRISGGVPEAAADPRGRGVTGIFK